MNILRKATLAVSLMVELADSGARIELCAGCTVEVTDKTDGDRHQCLTRDGREVWIEDRYLL